MVCENIGHGSFGDIYRGIDKNKEEEVAIKLENAKTRRPQLQYESRIYAVLSGGTGIPNVRWYGREKHYNIMVLDLLGPSLEDCFNYCDRIFSLKTVLMIADALISRIEYIHSQNFLHRDIKPDNFLVGANKRERIIYAIDFGLAKRYRHPKTKEHIPPAEKKSLTGTPRYASCNNHLGLEQSRRDDLESLGYVFMYFLRGNLPWQGLDARSKREKYQRILDVKQRTKLSTLCAGHPKEFAEFIQYARRLEFADKPSYRMLKNLFRGVMERMGYKYVLLHCKVFCLQILVGAGPVSLSLAQCALLLPQRYDNEFDWVVRRRTVLAKTPSTNALPSGSDNAGAKAEGGGGAAGAADDTGTGEPRPTSEQRSGADAGGSASAKADVKASLPSMHESTRTQPSSSPAIKGRAQSGAAN